MTCRHHWLIEPADGAESKGRCRLCGARATFSNMPPQVDVYRNYPEPKEITPFRARGAFRPTPSAAWLEGH